MAADPIRAHFDEQEIDRIFAAVDQSNLPGAAVAIAIDSIPVYRKGFGRANLELPALLTPSMRMRIASTTKHFTCLAYLLLCEDGKARIDDEIGLHVPGLHAVTARAKVCDLMGHVSGIRDVLSVTIGMHGIKRPITERQMLAYYKTIDDADFAAGTQWNYNNGAYMLLTAAVERISGGSLDEFLRERIFEPAGMLDTMLRRWDSDFVPNSAALHHREAAGNFTRNYLGMEIAGAGGIVSTMDDMLRWLQHMRTPVIGTAETWALMRKPQRLANGTSTGYGLGLMTDVYRGVETLHHSGVVLGGNSQMITVPDAGLDISIAVNRSDVSAVALALRVIDACVEGLDPAAAKADYEKLTGTFLSASTGRVVSFSVKNDMHLMSVDGAAGMPVSPDAEGTLRLPAGLPLQFSARSEGDGIVFVDFGNEDAMSAIETDPEARLCAHAGAYRSDALDTTITIAETPEMGRLHARGRHGFADYVLEPLTADIWRADHQSFPGLGAIVTFDVDGLIIDFTRLRHVRFKRIG